MGKVQDLCAVGSRGSPGSGSCFGQGKGGQVWYLVGVCQPWQPPGLLGDVA